MTRREQRERTREVLLDATMGCLVEYGYAGTTTLRIQQRAGVSRGALSHHFASKSDLLVGAIHHIAEKRFADVNAIAQRLDTESDALGMMVNAIREAMSGPPFQAALELWSASRTDEQLRESLLPAERELGAAIRAQFISHAGIADPISANVAFESLMALVRGLELTRLMRADDTFADLVIDNWLEGVARMRDR